MYPSISSISEKISSPIICDQIVVSQKLENESISAVGDPYFDPLAEGFEIKQEKEEEKEETKIGRFTITRVKKLEQK